MDDRMSPPSRTSQRTQLFGLAGWAVLTGLAALIAAIASTRASMFYVSLDQPLWAPPAWLFAPMWTTLYTLMAIAAWLVWRDHGWSRARTALGLYVVQLGANALWTWLYFVLRLGAVSFAEILLLWLLIAATLIAFWRLRPLAGVLLLPYLAWVTLACALTWSTWQRNPGVLG